MVTVTYDKKTGEEIKREAQEPAIYINYSDLAKALAEEFIKYMNRRSSDESCMAWVD